MCVCGCVYASICWQSCILGYECPYVRENSRLDWSPYEISSVLSINMVSIQLDLGPHSVVSILSARCPKWSSKAWTSCSLVSFISSICTLKSSSNYHLASIFQFLRILLEKINLLFVVCIECSMQHSKRSSTHYSCFRYVVCKLLLFVKALMWINIAKLSLQHSKTSLTHYPCFQYVIVNSCYL